MGYYPTVYKNGELIFAPKPGKDPKMPENDHCITLLEVPGKILQMIINDRFIYFYESNNILSLQQFGFRKKKGTDTAIAIAYETRKALGECRLPPSSTVPPYNDSH